jgi:hypothetical protein
MKKENVVAQPGRVPPTLISRDGPALGSLPAGKNLSHLSELSLSFLPQPFASLHLCALGGPQRGEGCFALNSYIVAFLQFSPVFSGFLRQGRFSSQTHPDVKFGKPPIESEI